MGMETRVCQNCRQEFRIEPEDFTFYEKIQVPAPTWCPECRLQRRTMFRNERVLYKRKCDLCGTGIITTFAPNKPYKVYCSPCWWSDKWNALQYGIDYDSNKNFFEQFKELTLRVPYPNLVIDYPTLINSDYVNHAGHLKNCYLIFDADFCENVYHATTLSNVKDSMDALIVGESELCYTVVNCGKCFMSHFSEDLTGCHDVLFSKDLVGCSHCFGCTNLRNKQYHIFNTPVLKEEYEQRIAAYKLNYFSSLEKLKAEVYRFWERFPRKFMHGLKNVNISGDYVYQSKNAHFMYASRFVEDGKFCQRLLSSPIKDVYDYFEWGNNAQRIYECVTVGEYVNNIKFSSFCFKNSMNVEYSMGIVSSADIFGCVGVRNGKWCILNKTYEKDEYEKLKARIIRDIIANPYCDSRGRIFTYGEFFPYDVSFYGYNESTAMQYLPLSKERAEANGWRWHEYPKGEYEITLQPENIPDNIHDVPDDIVKDVLGCAVCKRPFRLIHSELDLLRRFNFPIPRKCSECRHVERMARLNLPRFYHRRCMCNGEKSENGIYTNIASHFHSTSSCHNEFETSYSPERPEIVYCESCYNSEVA